MDSWQLEEKAEMTQDQIRTLLKAKREKEALKRIKKQNG
jgi:hypothetical protein